VRAAIQASFIARHPGGKKSKTGSVQDNYGLIKKKSTNVIQQAPPSGIFTISRSLPQMGTALKHKAIVMFGFEKDTAKSLSFHCFYAYS